MKSTTIEFFKYFVVVACQPHKWPWLLVMCMYAIFELEMFIATAIRFSRAETDYVFRWPLSQVILHFIFWGFTEEILFRLPTVIILNRALRKIAGEWLFIPVGVISSLVFGLAHTRYEIPSQLLVAAIGMFYYLIFYKIVSNHNWHGYIYALIITGTLHATHNIGIELIQVYLT